MKTTQSSALRRKREPARRMARFVGMSTVLAICAGAAVAESVAPMSFAGNVVASDTVGLSYEARGCITRISEPARRSGAAEAGQVLVELDRRVAELALKSAQARLLDLEAAVDERQLAIDSAQANNDRRSQEREFSAREFKRNDTMFRRGLINETTMETVERRMMDADFAVDLAEESLASALSAMRRAEIALEIGQLEVEGAELDLAAMVLTAPFDGILVGFDPDIGDCVTEGALAAQIYAPNRKAVEFFVRIDQLLEMEQSGGSVGSPVRITRGNGQTCGGVVTWIDSEANLETQYVKSSVAVEEDCAPDLFINEAVEVVAVNVAPDA